MVDLCSDLLVNLLINMADDWLRLASRILRKMKLYRTSRIGIVAFFILCYSTIWIFLYSQQMEPQPLEPFFDFWNSPEQFSACLLVMDDNHYLIEWLAYHYHALNLRTLILVSDPNSQTSPSEILERWKGLIDITEWIDADYMTLQEFDEARLEVTSYFSKSQITPKLISHRARQRLFYYKCMKQLKQRRKSWVLLTDTDEFVHINQETLQANNMTASSLDQPGSVAGFLQNNVHKSRQVESLNDNQPLFILQSSPCIQIPRLRFMTIENTTDNNKIQRGVPFGFNASNFLTMRSRTHTQPTDYKKNKIAKTIIDLTRVNEEDLLPVDSIHLPIRSICQQRRLHLRKAQSLLIINHYLGGYEQYIYRENDARLGKERSQAQWKLNQRIQNPQSDDEIRPWLEGFVQRHPNSAQDLLENVGQLTKKSWKTFEGNPDLERCAFCFFGLPRAYRNMVLPSIVKNILIPNARHNCDVYVHFYEQYEEKSGRKNRGGKVDPHEVFLLEQATKAVQKRYGPRRGRNAGRIPLVEFTYDTEEQFMEKRGDALHRYHHTVKKDGTPAYYPWKTKTYTNSSIDNMVKQWHSIEFAFKLMDVTAKQHNVIYSRVAMLRSDAMYLTPIDIAMLDKEEIDTKNHYVAVAPFARMPVNDRMIYGPYDAVKVWSTRRFDLIEERVQLAQDPGYEMHSEHFLNASIFPVIEALGYETNINRDICFVRTRADESAMVSDCQVGGTTRGWSGVDKKGLVESIVQRNCTYYKMGFKWTFVGCGEGVEYHDGK